MQEKQKRFGLGVFACVFNSDLSKILLVKRNAAKRKKWNATWGNIGGKIEHGETSRQACIREAKEEIGITFSPDSLVLISVKELPDYTVKYHAVNFVYVATLDETNPITINAESEDYAWFSLDDLPDSMTDSREDILSIRKTFKQNRSQ